MGEYEVVMEGGGPWGIRLQGGKDFGVQLNVARVTPGSKASLKGVLPGDIIQSINGQDTETLTHMEAQNLIKAAGARLQLGLKQGKSTPQDDKDGGSSGFAAQPKQTLYTTNINHSAGVDHKYNAKPKSFISSTNSSVGGVSHVSVPVKKFDPGEYARKKKEELDRYKEEKPVVDSDVLKMLQKTTVQDKNNAGLQKSEEDLPPPPPELMGNLDQDDEEAVHQVQSNTFRMLQQHVEAGTGDQVPTGLDKPRNHSHGSLPQPMVRNVPRFDPHRETTTTVDPIPKAPFPSGPNFKVGKPSAPSFKSSSTSSICSKGPPPPAVNAGEIVNPNSRLYQTGAYPAGGLLNDDYVRSHVNSTQDDFGRTRVNSQDDFGWGRMGSGSNIAPQNFNNRRPSGNEASCPTSPSPRGQPAQSGEKKLVCQTCQESLNGPFVSAIGKTWHPDHFCCSSCKVSLQNQAFVEENNQLFCEKCYNQFYAPKCAHCNNAIIGNCVNALGKSWHPDHFICSFCSKSFGNDGFLVDSGRPYCGKCFEDLFSVKCAKCAQSVTGGEKYVEALNKNWHSECFNCTHCNVRLEGNSFYVNRGYPYCQQHKTGY